MGGGTSAHAAEPLLAPVEAGGRRKPRLALTSAATDRARLCSRCSVPSTNRAVTARRVGRWWCCCRSGATVWHVVTVIGDDT